MLIWFPNVHFKNKKKMFCAELLTSITLGLRQQISYSYFLHFLCFSKGQNLLSISGTNFEPNIYSCVPVYSLQLQLTVAQLLAHTCCDCTSLLLATLSCVSSAGLSFTQQRRPIKSVLIPALWFL